MDQVQHKNIDIGGLKLHVAHIGTGPSTVLFLHGFPETWYSWRHQLIAVAKAGYRAIAPDYRGYGLSEQPPEPEKATYAHFITDLLAILDSLRIAKVYLVAKDFGAFPAYLFALLHPERVLGVVTMGVPFIPPGPTTFHKYLPEGFYLSRWKEPGRAEADFGRFDAKTVVKNIYILFSRSEVPIAAENQEIMDLVDPSTPLPPWFTEEDLATYGALYERSGFQTALQVPYRSYVEECIPDPKVELPALLIMGCKDYVFKFPGMEDYLKSGKVKDYVPNLEIVFLPEGTHFVQEQSPDQVNQLILTFLNNHKSYVEECIPDPKVELPALLIMGCKDYVFKFPGLEDYLKSGKVKDYVPNLEIVFLPEGTHFVQEQSPEQVNQLILTFLNNH